LEFSLSPTLNIIRQFPLSFANFVGNSANEYSPFHPPR
jgi:hypothetical protein